MRLTGNSTTNARFRFLNGGNFYVEDDTSPIIMAQDNTNGVQTKLQSADNAGILGTVTAHSLQLRTNNSPVAQFETSGRFTLSNYGGDAFTGTLDNLLGVQSNGVVIEVDVDEIDDQDLSDGGRVDTMQTIDITNGNSVTFSVADNDNDSTNEIQTLSKSGDDISLSLGGGTVVDDHLGTADQTLSANRSVTQGNFDLNFDANTLVIDGSANNVGIGILTPSAKLHLSGDVFRHDFTATGGSLGADQSAYVQTANDGTGNFLSLIHI